MGAIPDPQPVRIVGTVVDQYGWPVSGVAIDYANVRRRVFQSDAQGRFELDTDAPVLVIRKIGFQGAVVRTRATSDARVTLRKVSETLPICPAAGHYIGIEGWAASFRFPKIRGVKAGKQGRDIDYGVRGYYVETAKGPKGIRHGSGPMWSSGAPSEMDVWQSTQYEEIDYDNGARPIIDARGQLADGTQWRFLGMYGESADYHDVDRVTARILDQVLNGACIKLRPSPQ